MIKKIMIMGLGIFAVSLSLGGLQVEASRIDEWKFYYDLPNMWTSTTDSLNGRAPDTDIGKLITNDAVKNDDGLLAKLMVVFKLDTDEYTGPQKAFYYLKKLINYGLSFVSLIAFGLLLYAFYMMLIGDWEKWRTQVKSTLKGIVIALIAMSVSWLIVSMIFLAYDQQRDQTQQVGTSQVFQP